MRLAADMRYVCDVCGRVFVDDQLGYEEHLITEHERLTQHTDVSQE